MNSLAYADTASPTSPPPPPGASVGGFRGLGHNSRARQPKQGRLVETHLEDAMDTQLAKFRTISLEATNKSSRMLKRTDNKYVLNLEQFMSVIEILRDDFSILEIDGKQIFTYRSCYFDDNYSCYYEHHQGRRKRFKVRIRHYVDSDQLFFEVKLKDGRGQTNKKRIPCDDFAVPRLSDDKLSMLRKFYFDTYHKEFLYDLSPALIVSCKRLTLVSNRGGERVTIDFNLGFETMDGSSLRISDDFIIVETKSEDGRGISDRALKKSQIRQVSKCSKYCLGNVLSGNVSKYNEFRHIIKILQGMITVRTIGQTSKRYLM